MLHNYSVMKISSTIDFQKKNFFSSQFPFATEMYEIACHKRWKTTCDSKCRQWQQLLKQTLCVKVDHQAWEPHCVHFESKLSSMYAWYPSKHAPTKRKEAFGKKFSYSSRREAHIKGLKNILQCNYCCLFSFAEVNYQRHPKLLR